MRLAACGPEKLLRKISSLQLDRMLQVASNAFVNRRDKEILTVLTLLPSIGEIWLSSPAQSNFGEHPRRVFVFEAREPS